MSQKVAVPDQVNQHDIIAIQDELDWNSNIDISVIPASVMSENKTLSAPGDGEKNGVQEAVEQAVVVNPVEILRCLQNNMITGRPLNI